MDLRKLLAHNNYIIVNKELAKIIGLDESVMLGELCNESIYWEEKGLLENGYFYSTLENIENSITFKPKKQKKLLDHLIELKLIDVKLKGIPAKRYIKILEDGLSNIVHYDQSTLVKKDNVDYPKSTNYNSQNDKQILLNKNNNKINTNIRESRNFMDYNDKSKIATVDDLDISETF